MDKPRALRYDKMTAGTMNCTELPRQREVQSFAWHADAAVLVAHRVKQPVRKDEVLNLFWRQWIHWLLRVAVEHRSNSSSFGDVNACFV